MRSDRPAERELLDAEDHAFAALLDEYLATTDATAHDRFWARATDQLGPVTACRLNAAITRYEALAHRRQPATRKS